MPTRPPIERTFSAQSQVKVLESPPVSESTLSTTSVVDDQYPTPPVTHHDSHEADTVRAEEEEEERGRSTSIDTLKYEMDPRNMSPRRDSEELDQLGAEAKAKLEAQARSLQSGLLALLDRVDKVREEHDKLEGENKILQEYIGSLMATSRITGTSSSNRKSGGRVR